MVAVGVLDAPHAAVVVAFLFIITGTVGMYIAHHTVAVDCSKNIQTTSPFLKPEIQIFPPLFN